MVKIENPGPEIPIWHPYEICSEPVLPEAVGRTARDTETSTQAQHFIKRVKGGVPVFCTCPSKLCGLSQFPRSLAALAAVGARPQRLV